MPLPRTIPDLLAYLNENFKVEETRSARNSAGEQHHEFTCAAVSERTIETLICEQIWAYAMARHQPGATWSWRVTPEFAAVDSFVDFDACAAGMSVRDATTISPALLFFKAYARASVIGGRPLTKAEEEKFAILGLSGLSAQPAVQTA